MAFAYPSRGDRAPGIANLMHLVISTNFDLRHLVSCHMGFFTAVRVLNLFRLDAKKNPWGPSLAGSANELQEEMVAIEQVFNGYGSR